MLFLFTVCPLQSVCLTAPMGTHTITCYLLLIIVQITSTCMSLIIGFLNNLLNFMLLQLALFTFVLIASVLMCIRNQHDNTCMPEILLCKLTCCWNLLSHVFLFCRRQMWQTEEVIPVVLITTRSKITAWAIVAPVFFKKRFDNKLSVLFSAASPCARSFLSSVSCCYWLNKSWLEAPMYRINQLHKHTALIWQRCS